MFISDYRMNSLSLFQIDLTDFTGLSANLKLTSIIDF